MASARPGVATEVSAIPEIVQYGRSGILCPSGHIEVFAQAFSALEVLSFRESLGENGRARVRDQFPVDRMATAISDVYETILGDQQAMQSAQSCQPSAPTLQNREPL